MKLPPEARNAFLLGILWEESLESVSYGCYENVLFTEVIIHENVFPCSYENQGQVMGTSSLMLLEFLMN